MLNKLYAQIKKNVSENFKVLLVFICIMLISIFPLPYYIDTPGGAIDISKKIEVKGKKEAKGSLNFAYVSELKATTVTYLLSFFNKEWKVLKKSDVTYDNETIQDMEFRDKLLLEESNDNAIIVAYKKLGNEVKVKQEKIYVTYVDEKATTTLQVEDQITHINGEKVTTRDALTGYIRNHKAGDVLHFKAIHKGKDVQREATLMEVNGSVRIGTMINSDKELESLPSISIQKDASESGPSGGLMLSLAIYNSLTEEDITNGYKIVGTGTIDLDGTVGSIGGVEFKLKGAVKEKADIFLVPAGENYKEAMQLKKEKKYKIKIKAISTFEEALTYLKKQ